jgi:hypothetical protein
LSWWAVSFVVGQHPRIVPVQKVVLQEDNTMDVLEQVASVSLEFAEDNLSDARHYYLPVVAPELGFAYRFVVLRSGVWAKQEIQDEDQSLVGDAIYLCLD